MTASIWSGLIHLTKLSALTALSGGNVHPPPSLQTWATLPYTHQHHTSDPRGKVRISQLKLDKASGYEGHQSAAVLLSVSKTMAPGFFVGPQKLGTHGVLAEEITRCDFLSPAGGNARDRLRGASFSWCTPRLPLAYKE